MKQNDIPGDFLWARARVRNSAAQSIPNATTTSLSFDTERWDNDLMFDPVTGTLITIRRAGFYLITGNVQFAAGGSTPGVHQLQIRRNFTEILAVAQLDQVSTVNTARLSVVTAYELQPSDDLELRAFQQCGAAKNVDVVPNFSPEFGVSLIHPL